MPGRQSQLLSLKQLSKGRNEKKIKIRVVRLWNTYNPRKNDELMSMDFIGLDEKKDAMHFMIRSKFVPDFNRLIVEGNFYFMKNFRVDGCKEKYRLLDQDTFILFDATTCVEEIIMNLPTIPRYYFSLVPYDKLESVGDNRKNLVDIIGIVVGVSSFGDRMAAGSNIKMCKLDLMDTRENRLRLTIWNQEAKLLSEFGDLSNMGNKILIVTSTIISKDGGQIVASSSSATQFYSDLDSPDVHEFRATLQGKELDHVVKEIQLFSSSVSRSEYERHKKKIEDIQTA